MVKKDLIDKWIKKKSMSNIKEEKMTKRLSEKQINAIVELLKEYRKFALELFQCKEEPHTLAGIELDGYLGQDHVLVFKWKKNGNGKTEYVMDRGFIDSLHSILGNRIGKRFFIIAPAASVMFLEDYIEKDGIRYYVLRIPYSVIDELHKKNFKALKQPTADMKWSRLALTLFTPQMLSVNIVLKNRKAAYLMKQ